MGKRVISDRQGVTIMTLFIMGSTLLLGTGSDAKQDIWLAIIIAIIFTIPMIAIYSRILSLFPEKNLYEILNIIFGRFGGKAPVLLFTWYAFHLGALVLRNFQEFIKVVAFIETPEFVPTMFMGILCIWVVKEGIEVLGRWSQPAFLFLAFVILTISVFSFTMVTPDNLRPFLYNGIKPVLNSAFSAFSFPFAETVVLMAVFNLGKIRNNPYKIYYCSLAIGGFLVFMISVRNMLVLGPDTIADYYFPSYVTISLIEIGNFFERIEVSVSVILLFAGFVKISICLFAASNGIASLFKIDDYRQIVAPIGLMMMITSCFIYQNIMEMEEWALKIYKYYAFPFQVVLPVMIWIAAEIKAKNRKQLVKKPL